MPPDPQIPSRSDKPAGEPLPPIISPAPPIGNVSLPSPTSGTSPPIGAKPRHKPGEHLLTIVLSLCMGSFLADGIVSLIDDTSILLFNIHALTTVRVLVFLLATLLGILVYFLMGLTPMVPKRLFLPVTLFNLAAQLVVIPFYIYAYRHAQLATWAVSLIEVVCAFGLLYWIHGSFRIRWPLLTENQLKPRRFSWLNLGLFFGLNLLVLLPAVLLYLWVCAARAVDHFSDSFMALRPGGFTVQVKTYVRSDGKKLELVPMSHIGEPEFYRELSQSFPTNALILMEGVSDNRDLLTNKISYKRVARSLGLAEQQTEFKPIREHVVRADVDVEEFAPSTIDLLNVAMLIHTKGLTPQTVAPLMQYSPPPRFEAQLVEDLLRKRNRRLLAEIHSRLSESDYLIVPWGVAHMPEIAREIQKSGFHPTEIRQYVAIRFGSAGKAGKTVIQGERSIHSN